MLNRLKITMPVSDAAESLEKALCLRPAFSATSKYIVVIFHIKGQSNEKIV